MNIRRELKFTACALCAISMMTSCASMRKSGDNGAKTTVSADNMDFDAKSNKFAGRMFEQLCKEEPGSNVTLSPLSMQYLLAMVANGASDAPRKELMDAMGYGDCTIEELNSYYGGLSATLPEADAKVDLALSNSVWVQKDFQVKESFIDCMSKVFDAQVNSIDFQNTSEAKSRINSWCDKSTKGLIKQTSLDINPQMKLVLANAAYFNGTWTIPFEKSMTSLRTFHLSDGNDILVKMMSQSRKLGYEKAENYEAVELPYGNRAFSMLLLLPATNITADQLVNSVDWNGVNLQAIDVDVKLPRFKVDSHWKNFDNTLKTLGVKKIMTQGNQLDNIAPQLFVAKVAQDVCVEVNEEGTKAAAVSAGGIMMTSVNREVKKAKVEFNRPFLFAVRDNNSNAILFMGKVENPKSE